MCWSWELQWAHFGIGDLASNFRSLSQECPAQHILCGHKKTASVGLTRAWCPPIFLLLSTSSLLAFRSSVITVLSWLKQHFVYRYDFPASRWVPDLSCVTTIPFLNEEKPIHESAQAFPALSLDLLPKSQRLKLNSRFALGEYTNHWRFTVPERPS